MASIRRKFLIKKIISLFISIFASKFRCMEPKHLNRLRVIIAEKNLTNKWLSEQLGVGQATISKWVQNNAQPVFQMLLLMAEGYAARYRGRRLSIFRLSWRILRRTSQFCGKIFIRRSIKNEGASNCLKPADQALWNPSGDQRPQFLGE